MSSQTDSIDAPKSETKTAVKVIVLILGILGLLGMMCGCAVGALYAIIPASAVPVGTSIDQMRLGGSIIAVLIAVPAVLFMIIALCLWFFLWRKH